MTSQHVIEDCLRSPGDICTEWVNKAVLYDFRLNSVVDFINQMLILLVCHFFPLRYMILWILLWKYIGRAGLIWFQWITRVVGLVKWWFEKKNCLKVVYFCLITFQWIMTLDVYSAIPFIPIPQLQGGFIFFFLVEGVISVSTIVSVNLTSSWYSEEDFVPLIVCPKWSSKWCIHLQIKSFFSE